MNKNSQPLTTMQKLMFGLVCWGTESWSQAKSFKANGYDQKYTDATKSMYTGLAIYGLAIVLFVLILFLYN